MEDNKYYREIMINYSLIIILCLFLVVYIVINYSIIQEGNIYGGNIPKTIIITGVIFLILYVFLTWDDENNENYEDIVIPKYKINNKVIIKEEPLNSTPKSILKISNKYNSKYVNENSVDKVEKFINKNEISDNPLENSNIFVSQKNRAKFGIKF